MRTAPEYILNPALRDRTWFIGAIALGVVWGFSVEPLHISADESTVSGLKLLAWLIVAVLCLCLVIMAWVLFPGGGRESAAVAPASVIIKDMATPADAPVAAARPDPPQGNDPFLAALDYLGHGQATVRIGGILALERLVRQGGDPRACTGTLAAFVQQWAGGTADKPVRRPGYDVVAALAVLSRLLPSGDPLRNLADLRRVNLAGLELPDADLSRFHLEHADLSGADLRGVNFRGVNFRGADLRGAQLSGAVFTGASLRGADLTGAVLSDDEFGPADFSKAGNISAAQLLHIRYHPARPPRLPAGMQLTSQSAAIAV